MAPINLAELIRGLLAVVLLANALGQGGKLSEWSRKEFAKSLRPAATRNFFPLDYRGPHHRRPN